ncbi:anti-sigma factor [Pelagibius sp. CAU 1746]|uniref:anti-sigma factor n=1 Tax=Pelagibius sp. CAU 1746 TaxID=3140370 RepID=UPI00325BD309
MRYDDPHLQEALASAYVAGALHGRARRRFEVLMRSRPDLRRRVEAWEDHLTPLSDATPAVQPPARVWQAIRKRVSPDGRSAPGRGGFWNSLAFWRPFGAVAAVFAILLAGYAALETVAPWEEDQVARDTPRQASPSYVAVLEDDASQPVMVVTAFKGPWRVVVEPLRELSPSAGKTFQVWAVERDSGSVRPLLQVSSGEVLRLPLDDDGWTAIKTSESLAVTLEDAGASPAAPTGPVLYSGLCLNLKGPAET